MIKRSMRVTLPASFTHKQVLEYIRGEADKYFEDSIYTMDSLNIYTESYASFTQTHLQLIAEVDFSVTESIPAKLP